MFEFNESEYGILDEIMEVVGRHPDIALLRPDEEPVFSIPSLEIYPGRRKVYCGRREVSLTPKEYDLLCLLVANRGQVLTYAQIYGTVWGAEAAGDERNSVKCHVRNLRGKLHRAAEEPPYEIRCVREVGYCFEEECGGGTY